jgi:outer membrane protein assembly factor BamC
MDFLYSTYKRDKFRTRIEQGKEKGTVEIYISHRGMEQVPTTKIDNNTPAAFAWALMPPDPNLEAEMLARLMVKFGASQEKAKTDIVAATTANPQTERARVVTENEQSRLIVDDSFDRAWRRVGLALDRVGFTVTDRNRAEGIYYVRYADPESDVSKAKNEGFFSNLAFWRSKTEVVPENYQVNVASVNATQSAVLVVAEKAPAQNTDIERILNILKDQLK